MQPKKQGDHDGACGFYAIGNALKFLYPRINTDVIFEAIFNTYFELHDTGRHLINGTNRVQLTNILKGTLEKTKLDVTVQTPFWNSLASLSEFRTAVVEHLNETNTAAIVSYFFYKDRSNDDDFGHWTVLQRATAKSVYTFDSSNAKSRIGFNEMRVARELTPHTTRPYLFRSSELFLLKREN